MKKHLAILFFSFMFSFQWTLAFAQSEMKKPDYKAPNFHPEAKLVTLAKQKLFEMGLSKKYDLNRPIYLQTPSQLGEDYVAFPLPCTEKRADGHLRLHCLVHVSSLFGRVIRVQELTNKSEIAVYARITPDGNVIGYKTEYVTQDSQ